MSLRRGLRRGLLGLLTLLLLLTAPLAAPLTAQVSRVTGTGTAGTAAPGVVTVQGISSGTPVDVTGSTIKQGASDLTGDTLQSAATANGNGTPLSVSGYAVATLTVNCSGCAGGTTVNFEISSDGTNYVAIQAVQVFSTPTFAATTTTSGITVWRLPVAGFSTFRARISAYSAGTVTVVARAHPIGDAAYASNTLPSGAATESTLLSLNGKVTAVNTGAVVLAAGTAAFGKLSANSGVDIGDVDVTSVSGNVTVVQGTGTNLHVVCDSGCSGSGGTSMVDDAAFTPATSLITPAGAMFDDVSPDSVNEGDGGVVRMSANRNLYVTLRDAAGNERGLNIDASGALAITVASIPSHAVTNAGTFAVQADTEITTPAALADNTANPTLGAVASYLMCFDGTTWDRCLSSLVTESTHNGAMTADSTVGTSPLLLSKDFDGAALPNVVSAEGDAVLPAASLYGVQYMMLVSEDGSLQYGTATTPLVVGDGSGALNVICDSGCSGGTQYTHDAALTIGSSLVTLAGARASAAVPTDVSADNDAVALWALRSGALAVQPTFGGILGVAGNGTSGTGVQRVTIASDSTGQVALAAGSATIGALTANQSVNVAQINGVTPLMGAGNTGTGSHRVTISTDQAALVGLAIYVEDAAETAGGNLSMAGTVRRDTQASSAGTTGDNATLNTDATGNLWITGTAIEDAAETAGGTLLMAGSVRRDTLATSAGTTGDNATINTNALGAVWVSQYDPCSSEAKTTDPISLTARGVIVAATASKKNYICAITLVAGAAEIMNIVEGTGTTCQTGTAAIAGSTTAANGLSFAANSGLSANGGNGTALAGKTANVDTCFVPSGSNRVSGWVTYVQR